MNESLQKQLPKGEPNFLEFNPCAIPWQASVVDFLQHDCDYSIGIPLILLSGSMGSAKSLLAAHLGVRHCIENPGAVLLLGRSALSDLKETILKKVITQLQRCFILGSDYEYNISTGTIRFKNGSIILCKSWHDKNYLKFRSLDLSAAILEELTENDDDDKQAHDEIILRLGRKKGIETGFLISCTNPDDPKHWAYKFYIEPNLNKKHSTRHVFYSLTEQNKFLPPFYIDTIKSNNPPKMISRLLYGQWIEINEEKLYYEYIRERNFKNNDYEVDEAFPIIISWDFNIGSGKPLSVVIGQKIKNVFHWFGEVIVEGMRTLDSCEELAEKGFLDYRTQYHIRGDATGKHKDTRSKQSDYDIIEKFFANHINKHGNKLDFVKQIPAANPPIRKRHNLVNAACYNALGQVSLYVYKSAPTIDEGLRLTALKKSTNIIEDDSKRYQHCSTALGYALWAEELFVNRTKSEMRSY